MKLEQQVCTLEQAKRLKELSVFGYSHFVWMNNKNNDHLPFIDTNDGETRNWMECLGSAYTVAELGVMLPHSHLPKYFKLWDEWSYKEEDGSVRGYSLEAHARAAFLIYLIENNFATAEEVNQRLNA